MEHLYDKLKQNQASGNYPYHMPGHKRNMTGFPMEEYYGIDITEIDGFDNLHKPQEILKEVMDRAAKLFGAETYLLINGSTGGILSAVSAALRKGQTLLMARNCHKAAYHAAYLNECRTEYCYPEFLETYGICGVVSPEKIAEKLDENPDIKAIFFTSPTYDGVVSDVEKIVEAAHRKGIAVIVDEAHGAHFGLDERFPKSAVECGADIVIHSIHKTLPAFTQTALLHVQGELIDRKRLQRFLQIYQTSSPSYILMAGIEQCISILEKDRKILYNNFFEQNKMFEKQIENLQYIKVLSAKTAPKEVFAFDAGKKIISVRGTGLTGQEIYAKLLEKYGLQMEMAGQDYVTAIMTIMDCEEGYVRLAKALMEMDAELADWSSRGMQRKEPLPCAEMEYPLQAIYIIHEAWEKDTEKIYLEQCEGEISAEFVHIYPPGIPLIVPGERFTKAVVEQLLRYRQQGLTIEGLYDSNKMVSIIRRENCEKNKNHMYNRTGE